MADRIVRVEVRRSQRAPDPLPWHPDTLPPPGFRLDHDGVTFEAVTSQPYDGSRYPNVTWRTHCTGCGIEMTTMSKPAHWRSLHRKRCSACVAGDLDAYEAQRATR